MGTAKNQKLKIALVYGSLPSVEEIDQFKLLDQDRFEVNVVTSESICGYLTQNSRFQDLTCIALPDHDENPSFLPGLEKVLAGYDVVIVKERVGIYSYQAMKAKWKSRFRLMIWVDNLVVLPQEDLAQMRTIREEVCKVCDGFIVQSEAAKTSLLLEGIEEERIHNLLPWAEALVERTPEQRAKALDILGLDETNFVVTYTGQLEWEEGLYDLMHGAKLAIQKDASLKRRLRMVFCGIGSFAPEIRERMVAMGLDDRAVYVAPSREASHAIMTATDCMFVSSIPSQDRVDGDPYRLLTAMVNKIPVIASRSPLVEEVVGKHRIDFCQGSPASIAKAIKKAANATALTNNIIAKNYSDAAKRYSKESVTDLMATVLQEVTGKAPTVDMSSLDNQVAEAESKVSAKKYLDAIDLIQSIFGLDNIPTHHQANLYRLIGDSFIKLGDAEAGKGAYIQATELDPYSSKAFIGLGTVAMTKMNYDTAIIHFQKAVALAPNDEMANLGLGLAFQGIEEFEEANRWMVKANELDPENTAAIFSIVKVASEMEKYDSAIDVLKNYIASHPLDHNMVFTLGGIYYRLGEFQKTIDVVSHINRVDPMDERANELMAKAKRGLTEKQTSVG